MGKLVNSATLLGRLGSDLKLRHTKKGTPVTNFRLATNERWKDAQGNQHEWTEWHNITVFGPQAESCAKYLGKGRLVEVCGVLRTQVEEYEGQQRCKTEVRVQGPSTYVHFVDRPRSTEPAEATEEQATPALNESEAPF